MSHTHRKPLANKPSFGRCFYFPMDRLIENIRSVKNRCEIIEILHTNPNALSLIHTVLEDMYDVVHTLIDEYCVEKDE